MDKDTITFDESPVDYAKLMKDVLLRLQDGINSADTALDIPNLNNLITTALDYMFYLEDNRRVIL
jgi:hypothetical protein